MRKEDWLRRWVGVIAIIVISIYFFFFFSSSSSPLFYVPRSTMNFEWGGEIFVAHSGARESERRGMQLGVSNNCVQPSIK